MRTTWILPRFDPHSEGDSGSGLAELVAAVARECDLDVLTTCARDPADWRDYYDPGPFEIGGARGRRFRVDYARSPGLAERLRAVALSPASSPEIERRWIEEEGPYSSALLREIERIRPERDVFVFFGATAATTVLGAPCVAGKAVIVKQPEDAAALGVACIRDVLGKASSFDFASVAERDRLPGLVGALRRASGLLAR